MSNNYLAAFERLNRIVFILSEIARIKLRMIGDKTRLLKLRIELVQRGFTWRETAPENFAALRAKVKAMDEAERR